MDQNKLCPRNGECLVMMKEGSIRIQTHAKHMKSWTMTYETWEGLEVRQKLWKEDKVAFLT